MAGNSSTDRIVDWLEQSSLPPSGVPRSVSIHTHSEEQSQVSGTRRISSPVNNSTLDDALPHEIALPDSHVFSSDSDPRTDSDSSRDSLDDILKGSYRTKSPTASLQDSSLYPRKTREHRHLLFKATSRRTRRSKPRQRYQRTLDNAASILDHIQNGNVCKSSRHDQILLIHHDYSRNCRLRSKEIQNAHEIGNLGNPPSDVYQRVVIVKDLSKPTIIALGDTFGINPEFFEEHLLNSGYAGADYDMLPAKMWVTTTLEKSYVSAKWIRPVYRLPMYSWNYKMQDLAKTGVENTEGSSDTEDSFAGYGEKQSPKRKSDVEHFTRYGIVKTRVATNIFRPEARLWTNPNQATRTQRECALEERISIWKVKLPEGCVIVIILTDPLPAVEEKHPCLETTKVDWNKSWAHGGMGKKKSDISLGELDIDDDWAERGMPHTTEEGHLLLRATAEPFLIKWARNLKNIVEKRKAKTRPSPSTGEPELSLQKVIVKPISPRHTVTVDLDQVFESKESAQTFGGKMGSASTYDGICNDMRQNDGPMLLGSSIFHIIKQDTLTFLRRLSYYGLDEMETGILEETKMEDRLSDWIQAISYAQREISEMQVSMEPFVQFCVSMDSPAIESNSSESHSTTEPKVLREFQQLSEVMTKMSDRLQRTSTLLTSNLGLLESRRSINEAQAVSRLTELAFIFVPLSFASSIFGMQVQPLADPVPLRSFFIIAAGATLFAYFMRMTMRSQWLAYLKVALRRDVRKYAESHGLPAPTQSISIFLTVQWTGHCLGVGIQKLLRLAGTFWVKIWKVFGFIILFMLLNGSIASIPIAILWTRELDPGTQCAVTIAILVIVVGSVGPFVWTWCEPEFRSALPRLIGNLIRHRSYPSLNFVVFSGTIALSMVVSLILLWTQQLALGIKTGLTVGILIFVAPLTIIGLLSINVGLGLL